jgi:predicted anti-sigma-YlaC factor YlaD
MAATLNDQALLAADTLFVNRVRQALVAAAVAIANEAVTTAYHYKRAAFATVVLNSVGTSFAQQFAYVVAADANVSSDATGGGTYVALTTGNADTQQALATDPHIASAVSSAYNAFFSLV